MLGWMCGNTMIDIIRNQEFREKLGVAPISTKMREHRLRWFRHVQRKNFDAPMRRIESIIMEDKRSQGRPRRTQEEHMKNNLYDLHLSEDLIRDRVVKSAFSMSQTTDTLTLTNWCSYFCLCLLIYHSFISFSLVIFNNLFYVFDYEVLF